MTKAEVIEGPLRGQKGLRLIFLLWVTLIAFGLPEVIAGTGRMWITNPGSYILVMPLYALHFLLLTHIAVWTNRTSWSALYLLGVIFGLYETWITKVVWSGYPDVDGFSFGGVGPWFGLHETLGLVLFYHAVISFLLPLAVVSRLFPTFGRSFPVPDWVFGKTTGGLLRRVVLLLILGAVTGHNNPVIREYLITWVPLLVLIWGGFGLLRRMGVSGDSIRGHVATPMLSRTGFFVAVLWLAAIYGVTYVFLRPEYRPPVYIQLVTLAFYPILIFLIWKTPKCARIRPNSPHPVPARMPFFWLIAVFCIGLIGNILNGYETGVLGGLAVLAFLSMIVIGTALFVWLAIWRIILRSKQS